MRRRKSPLWSQAYSTGGPMETVQELTAELRHDEPAGVQSSAWLLELSLDWIVLRASENIHHLLHESHVTLIDEPLGRFVHAQALHDLRNLFARLSATTLSPYSLFASNGGIVDRVPFPVTRNIRPPGAPSSMGKPAPDAQMPAPDPLGERHNTALCARVLALYANSQPCQGPLSPCAP